MACQECGNTSDGIINGLCSSCTVKKHGRLFPWLEGLKKQCELIETSKVEFEKWLPTVCFQRPTPEAYDLAWQAWKAQYSAEPTAEHAPELNMTTLLKEFKEIEKRAEKMEAALEAISAWGDAYPLNVFPEPDFKRVRDLLEAGGISLDAVSASNMRHVIEGVAKIAREGLGEDQEVKYAKIDG